MHGGLGPARGQRSRKGPCASYPTRHFSRLLVFPVRARTACLGAEMGGLATCGWRIVISPIVPHDSPPCYHSSMRHLVVLFIHLIAILTQLLQPGGVRSLVAESLLLKHQLLSINLLISSLDSTNRFGQVYGTSDASKTQSGLIVNRSRHRSPTLSSWDRILAGWMALLVRPSRLLRSAIVLKPSSLLYWCA